MQWFIWMQLLFGSYVSFCMVQLFVLIQVFRDSFMRIEWKVVEICVAYQDTFCPMERNITCLQYSHLPCGRLCPEAVGGDKMLSADWFLLLHCLLNNPKPLPLDGFLWEHMRVMWTHVFRVGRMLRSFPLSRCRSCCHLAVCIIMQCNWWCTGNEMQLLSSRYGHWWCPRNVL